MQANYSLQVFDSTGLLCQAAATFMVDIAVKAVADRGRFTLSLSGGHTPEQLYGLLATPPFKEQLPWKDTYIFWGDERCVPATDERNNSNMAKRILLDKISVSSTNIYPVPVELPPAEAAIEYDREIKNLFKHHPPQFDLILLGLGENGHTASLFPGTKVLNETIHLVKEVYVEEQKMFRVTMTAPLINQAHHVLFLVTGKEKAPILKTILKDRYDPNNFPAQLIQPDHGSLYWMLDENAASLLY